MGISAQPRIVWLSLLIAVLLATIGAGVAACGKEARATGGDSASAEPAAAVGERSAAQAVPVAAVSYAEAPEPNDSGGGRPFGIEAVGWRFEPNVDIEITDLGFYDAEQDGLAAAHRVGVFDAETDRLIASVVITPGSWLGGAFRWESVDTRVELKADHPYLVASECEAGDDLFDPPRGAWAPEIAYDRLYWTADGFAAPHEDNPWLCFGGPNFKFVPAEADVPAGSASAAPASASPSSGAVTAAGRTSAAGVQLASDAVIETLEGRMAAMNEGDGEAAAAFYSAQGVLQETDMTPHYVTKGRERLAERLSELYDFGLRLAPAGAPTASGSYVAEPTRFYNGGEPGRGAGMLVFEVDEDGLLAYQWMIGWADGPEKTFALLRSPSVNEPNLPPRKVRRILDDSMAALGCGDARAAADDFAPRAILEVTDPGSGLLTRLRGDVGSRLKELSDGGLRIEPTSAPIAYDVYVAQPARFSNADGGGASAGMVVVEFDSAYRIVHAWIIGGAGSA